MQLHQISSKKISSRSHRVGRGGKRGKTSGRGGKGQTARAGNKPRPQWRDIIAKLPKRRGFGKNRGKTVVPKTAVTVIKLSTLAARFKDGDTISPQILLKSGIVERRGGVSPKVKVLGGEKIDVKLTFQNIAVSRSAQGAIEKAGGTISA